jgi:hypothetical protein
MKKPYLKLLKKIHHLDVWIVDGKYIRNNIDEEFTNFGQHYHFKYIPKNEFWIDQEHGKGSETNYFIDHLLVEHRLMGQGLGYVKALDAADKIEKRERHKSKLFQKIRKSPLRLIHKKLLKKYSGKINIWLVNGEYVRDKYYVDFTEGGHDLVYHFIPRREVWIDDDISSRERKFVLLHEIHERNLMSKMLKRFNGKVSVEKLDKIYLKAHHSSSEIEYFCRHHPKTLEKKLRNEIEKC